MIVAKSLQQRYDTRADRSRRFMASMGSTELALHCRKETRSRTASRRTTTKDSILSRVKDSSQNKIGAANTIDKGCKSVSTISTCLRSTSKRPTNDSFQPNSTIQQKLGDTHKYDSRKHNRLSSEAFSKTTKKHRTTKVHTQHSKQSQELQGSHAELQQVYRRVKTLLEQHRQKQHEWLQDKQLYQKTIELLVAQLGQPKNNRL